MDEQTKLKKKAAEFAVEKFIHSDMVVGLGVGSTAIFSLYKIAEKISTGELKNIIGIPCSNLIKEEAKKNNIPLGIFASIDKIDVTIDGADEVDENFNLIKGGGGALLREKIVAQHSDVEVIIVDESKYTSSIGRNWPLPIEVIPFGWESHIKFLENNGGVPELRTNIDNEIFKTDQGNIILDTNFGVIENCKELDSLLNNRVGIVAHGLFIDLATDVIVSSSNEINHYSK